MISLDPHDDMPGMPRLASEINVTPFIDVMLVLLVIFMVIAPLMLVGVSLNLPKTTAPTITQAQKPLIVSIDKDGKFYFGKDELSLGDLVQRLGGLTRDDPTRVVYVRADRAIDYGKVVDLLGRIGAAGVARVSLVAEGDRTNTAKP